MKNIDELISKDVMDKELTVYYVEALKNDDFKKLLTKLKIKEAVAKRFTTKLEETCYQLNNCKNCKSLLECTNPVDGFVYFPTKDGDNLRFDYVACKYKKKKNEELKTKSNFFDEPEEIISAKIKNIDLKDKKRVPAIKWINQFLKDYKDDKHLKGLYLHGSFGCGKTYILAALLNELSLNGASCVIVHFSELLRNLKESFDLDFKEKMEMLKTSDLVLLDDLGAENLTSWSRDEILGTILQYRMDAKLPTFITSNLNIDELENHLSKGGSETLKAKRIIERIKFIMDDIEIISENRRK